MGGWVRQVRVGVRARLRSPVRYVQQAVVALAANRVWDARRMHEPYRPDAAIVKGAFGASEGIVVSLEVLSKVKWRSVQFKT